ncbi:MAG: YbaB/EbfC family nucleoid-associated protein [Alphaproteobacteria bacterium]|nr:YbaB/EbfC family nucleoid-associated protein [Alphaproteobacteria bacterium]
MKNIGDLMKKAQQVQMQMNALQTKMEHLEFEGVAGSGAVKVTLTGKGVPVSVKIESSVVNPSDIETLEDLVMVAIADSKNKSEELLNSEMERMQASLGLPPDFKMPF